MLNVPIPKVPMNVGAKLVTMETASTAAVSKTICNAKYGFLNETVSLMGRF